MNPLSTSVPISSARTQSPTSRPVILISYIDSILVIPAQAGIQFLIIWFPAFAGTTSGFPLSREWRNLGHSLCSFQ